MFRVDRTAPSHSVRNGYTLEKRFESDSNKRFPDINFRPGISKTFYERRDAVEHIRYKYSYVHLMSRLNMTPRKPFSMVNVNVRSTTRFNAT